MKPDSRQSLSASPAHPHRADLGFAMGQVVGADFIERIEFAAAGQRCRRVVSRSNMRPTGRFPSTKMGRHMHWDSVHELNAFRLLESDATVRSYAEQPCVVHYRLDASHHRHYPDILVVAQDRKMLWEVKTLEDASRPDIARRTALMTREMPRFGYAYQLVLARDLGRQPRLANAKTLVRQARQTLSFETKEGIRRLFQGRSAVTWEDVASGALRPLLLADAYALVVAGELCIDIDRPLGPGSVFAVSPTSRLLGGSDV